MTWLVLTAANGEHEKLLEYSAPTLEAYARRWGMAWRANKITDTEFPASWNKIRLIQYYLGIYHGVLWMDADAMFVRYDEDIRPLATASWNWVHNRYTQGDPVVPCAGVVACTDDRVPAALWEMRFRHRDSPWWEQSAAHEFFGWDRRTGALTQNLDLQAELPARWDSTPASPSEDPVVFHASGLPMAERVRLMRDCAEAHPAPTR